MYLIIPSYEPDQRLCDLVKACRKELPDAQLIVVNDGSKPNYQTYFEESRLAGAIVLEHVVNKGKGAALKTALRFIQKDGAKGQAIVTADSDGQHLIKDIVRVAEASQKEPSALILGARAFVGKVPARSRFGNKVTAALFHLITGQKVTDTQTGLRAFSSDLIPWLLSLDGDRFEYEFNMLLEARKAGHEIVEVPIETVYLEENKSSHFRPIRDSIRIYAPFIKFSGSALTAALIDALALFILVAITGNLLLSVVLSRLISASSQCLLNAKLVFHPTGSLFKAAIRYFMLAAVILTCNYVMLKALVGIGIGLVIAKLLTETILFLVSYRVQHRFVFH
ncbi:glycosyltransferase [Streptococcus loxodontisalivarius]|uniref:Glycosyltransferase involved in cell wall biosynthesis n=1 Tax=Streptococcus loxodontisalivarius TaxID=1349415 RepID=A0ABS2PPP4_9STRE|nr:glycosyltransferase [Streptococcus loxodontisalivarius]MBM7642002.1 glycosyltransferase involved in cell wall biosynthesis [Streptococcus loxodontisalivarius]